MSSVRAPAMVGLAGGLVGSNSSGAQISNSSASGNCHGGRVRLGGRSRWLQSGRDSPTSMATSNGPRRALGDGLLGRRRSIVRHDHQFVGERDDHGRLVRDAGGLAGQRGTISGSSATGIVNPGSSADSRQCRRSRRSPISGSSPIRSRRSVSVAECRPAVASAASSAPTTKAGRSPGRTPRIGDRRRTALPAIPTAPASISTWRTGWPQRRQHHDVLCDGQCLRRRQQLRRRPCRSARQRRLACAGRPSSAILCIRQCHGHGNRQRSGGLSGRSPRVVGHELAGIRNRDLERQLTDDMHSVRSVASSASIRDHCGSPTPSLAASCTIGAACRCASGAVNVGSSGTAGGLVGLNFAPAATEKFQCVCIRRCHRRGGRFARNSDHRARRLRRRRTWARSRMLTQQVPSGLASAPI